MSELLAQLSAPQQSRLAELEAVVERGLQTFVEVGLALTEIRDARLYCETHATFAIYCRERFGFSRQHAYRQIDAALLAVALSPTGDTPASERQARELVPVLRELQERHGDKLTPEKIRQAVDERLRNDQTIRALNSSVSAEWYTPGRYVEAARIVLGGIDLDPASSALANETIKAELFFTAEEDGLEQPWHGCIWLNPPYGQMTSRFVSKLLAECAAGHVEAAILLLNGYSFDAHWFGPLWDHVLCFVDHRIHFQSPVRESGAPTHGSVFVYVGLDKERFARVFSRFGAVVERSPLVGAAAA